jgi:DNA ligase-associated metallophosphoesterase
MHELKPERLHPLSGGCGQTISICGKSLIADGSGAVYWPAQEALLVADLHLEKASAYAAAGILLPPYDTRETLIRLAEAIDRYQPSRVIALGDSLHDDGAAWRIDADDLERLRILQEGREWIWLSGNHDKQIASRLGGRVESELALAGISLRHRPACGSARQEIAGHMHPAAKLWLHGSSIRRPCFVGNGRRLILPAFGAFTGGLNVLDDAFLPLLGSGGMAVWMLGQEGPYAVASRLLSRD